jgi:ribonucleoside-diphosphate reductase alpha chain
MCIPSEPVENMASSVIAPEAGPPQDIPIIDTCPQRTMRVRTRNSSTEPIDVATIVRAVDRCCAGLPDIDPFRIMTKTINGFHYGGTTRKLGMIPGGGRLGRIFSNISGTHERPLAVSPRGLR